MAAGALPDGTPVIISGGDDGTVRVWRLADGTPVGEPLRGHNGPVGAVAAGALPDGTPVIISGGGDGTVRVWRLADGTPLGLRWTYLNGTGCRRSRQHHRHCGRGRHRRPPASAPAAHALAAVLFLGTRPAGRNDRIMAGYPVHRRASAPVLTREAARRMRDSGTLSGT